MGGSQYRQRTRAHETEATVAGWFAANGWPYAEPVGSGRQGTDVTGMPGLCVEVKARRDFHITGWLRQHHDPAGAAERAVLAGRGLAAGSAHPLPLVVLRPDGFGPAGIAGWPAILRLDDLTVILREAGYGG
jgi:hypothetical protein